MYDAWPWGFSPRLGVVYTLNNDTVARVSGARTFGSVKNTGGSSHWNGFFGGYNVTRAGLPRQLRLQLGCRLASLAGTAVPRA